MYFNLYGCKVYILLINSNSNSKIFVNKHQLAFETRNIKEWPIFLSQQLQLVSWDTTLPLSKKREAVNILKPIIDHTNNGVNHFTIKLLIINNLL